METKPDPIQPAGYVWLIQHLGLRVRLPDVRHSIGLTTNRSDRIDGPIHQHHLPDRLRRSASSLSIRLMTATVASIGS